jgi:hypothetical protein
METGIVDLRQVPAQDDVVALFLPRHRRAELRACLAEEAESYSGLMLLAEPVDFVCDREYAQAISIVARQSKAQDSEMPRTQ